ncbi:MAG: YjbQ family protein [Clostridia bacterium]|nr:YjbQ family protein [Clostridia bacterium]
MYELEIKTSKKEEFIDITGKVQEVVYKSGIKNGLCGVFVPHTTCALMVNENADPDVARDISYMLKKLVPDHMEYQHREGNSPAHIKSTLVGSSKHFIVSGGSIVLGTWQGIFLVEFDGPRTRRVWVEIVGN